MISIGSSYLDEKVRDRLYADVFLKCRILRQDLGDQLTKLGFYLTKSPEVQVKNISYQIWDKDLDRYNVYRVLENYDYNP
jgi:hypothetical protein